MGKTVAKTGSESNLAIWIMGGVALAGGIALYARTTVNKLLKMADFKLTDLRILGVKPLEIQMRASVLISNPSDAAINLTALRVEFLRLTAGKKEVLATTPTTKLVIPKNGNINYDIRLDVSTFKLGDLIYGVVTTGAASQLKGKISIRIKCEIAVQYIEKEIPYL